MFPHKGHMLIQKLYFSTKSPKGTKFGAAALEESIWIEHISYLFKGLLPSPEYCIEVHLFVTWQKKFLDKFVDRFNLFVCRSDRLHPAQTAQPIVLKFSVHK